MRNVVRYDTARDFGGAELETRREYNVRFGQPPGVEIDPPPIVGHVWNWFWELAAHRQHTEGGAQPMSFLELQAWTYLRRQELTQEEMDMLLSMDAAYVSAQSKEAQEQSSRKASRANLAPAPKRRM